MNDENKGNTPNLDKALFEVQKSISGVKRNQINSFADNAPYADLKTVTRAIRAELNEHGVLISQWYDILGDKPVMRMTLRHVETGETRDCGALYFPYPTTEETATVKGKNASQLYKSRSTYWRRMQIMTYFVLPEVDDDGNADNEDRGAAKEPTHNDRQHTPRAETKAKPKLSGKEAVDHIDKIYSSATYADLPSVTKVIVEAELTDAKRNEYSTSVTNRIVAQIKNAQNTKDLAEVRNVVMAIKRTGFAYDAATLTDAHVERAAQLKEAK